MKFSHALVYYGLFVAVVLIVTGGFIFKRTTTDESPLWITPQQVTQFTQQYSNSDIVFIDLSRYYYNDGHIKGSINYPKCAIPAVIDHLDKNKIYIVYCHGTGAPLSSAYKLKDAGFPYVFALRGNFGSWVDAGYPVENHTSFN